MKSLGIVRNVDELGRIVLPKELRLTLKIDQKDPLEIYVEGNKIFLKKYVPSEEELAGGQSVGVGIVRRVDELGRIVLPMELRKTHKIHQKDPLEIFVDGDCIVLAKYEPACIFCGNYNDTISYQNKIICKDCVKKLSEIV